MPKILTYNSPSDIEKKIGRDNPLKAPWNWFSSLHRFDKLFLVLILLVIISTPFIVSNKQIFNPQAAKPINSLPGWIWVGLYFPNEPAGPICPGCVESTEPQMPGTGEQTIGCGYVPGLNIHIVDSVPSISPTTAGNFILPPDFNIPTIGQPASVNFDIGPPDANGCMVPWLYLAWGTGVHTMNAYQTLSTGPNSKPAPTLMGQVAFNAGSHHPNDLFMDNDWMGIFYQPQFCLSWSPPPAPYTPYMGPVSNPATNLYRCSPDPTDPTVSITSPADGATFPALSIVTITADAAGGSGTPVVDFYMGDNLQCVVTAPPYTCSFQTTIDPVGGFPITTVAHSPSLMNWRSKIIGINTVAPSPTPTSSITITPTPTFVPITQPIANTGNITGTVSSSLGGIVSGAKITVSVPGKDLISNTDSLGAYTINNLVPGTYTLKFSAQGYVGQNSSATVTSNTTTTKNVTLSKR